MCPELLVARPCILFYIHKHCIDTREMERRPEASRLPKFFIRYYRFIHANTTITSTIVHVNYSIFTNIASRTRDITSPSSEAFFIRQYAHLMYPLLRIHPHQYLPLHPALSIHPQQYPLTHSIICPPDAATCCTITTRTGTWDRA